MLLDPDLRDDGDLKPAVGSLLIVKAESLSEVKAMIESDIYYTSGVVSFQNHTTLVTSVQQLFCLLVHVSGIGKSSLYFPSFPRRPSLPDPIAGCGLFHKLAVIFMDLWK